MTDSAERRCELTPLQRAYLATIAAQAEELTRQAQRLQREAVALIAAEHDASAEDFAALEPGPGGVVLVLRQASPASAA